MFHASDSKMDLAFCLCNSFCFLALYRWYDLPIDSASEGCPAQQLALHRKIATASSARWRYENSVILVLDFLPSVGKALIQLLILVQAGLYYSYYYYREDHSAAQNCDPTALSNKIWWFARWGLFRSKYLMMNLLAALHSAGYCKLAVMMSDVHPFDWKTIKACNFVPRLAISLMKNFVKLFVHWLVLKVKKSDSQGASK